MFHPDLNTIKFPKHLAFSPDEFFDFCQQNKDMHFERDADGNIILMSPSSLLSDHVSAVILGELVSWNKASLKKGIVFSSAAGFTLPDTSVKSPDVAWLSKEKWDGLTSEQKNKFAEVVPEFVVEVLSPSDSLKYLQKKMESWIENEVELAWLIDPNAEKAYVYNKEGIVWFAEKFNKRISATPVLERFEFDLSMLIE